MAEAVEDVVELGGVEVRGEGRGDEVGGCRVGRGRFLVIDDGVRVEDWSDGRGFGVINGRVGVEDGGGDGLGVIDVWVGVEDGGGFRLIDRRGDRDGDR